jgi:NADH:ubiquinone oxidoreductase subunit 6 (subunit J)
MPDLVLCFLLGMALFSVAGILFVRKVALAAFSLFAFLLSLALIFGRLNLHAAVVGQLVLYVGGAMVLVAFALHAYDEPENMPFGQFRQSMGKAALFVPLLLACFYFLPWKALLEWAGKQNPDQLPPADTSLKATGYQLATRFVVEFEWLGVLMLLALAVAGWYMKEGSVPKRNP